MANFVAAAFAQRRKMLRNSLKGLFDDAAFAELAIDPTLRAEDLALADYAGGELALERTKNRRRSRRLKSRR